jgi:hypothetical protein
MLGGSFLIVLTAKAQDGIKKDDKKRGRMYRPGII